MQNLTSSDLIKPWMNIGCNSINVNDIKADNIDVGSIDPPIIITASSDVNTPVFLRMDANSGDPNLRKFGYYYSNTTKNFWLALFNDSGSASVNFMCFEVTGGQPVVIPDRGLSLNNNGGLFNVPSNTGTDSFYREFTSSGNTYSGPFASPSALEYEAVRVGKNVTLTIGSIDAPATTGTVITASVALPVGLRPISVTRQIPIVSRDNSLAVLGAVRISNAGVISLGVGAGFGNYTASGNAGCIGCTVSFSVN